MTLAPPVMPRPDVSIEKQSAEEWFRVFKMVADSLIGIYTAANQSIVGQRQALATLPSLLNRNASEKRLANRILSECNTVEEAERLVQRTIGDLESECQASDSIYQMKRGSSSLEDFYADLIEKGKKEKIGATNVIKKFISELPNTIKSRIQRKFSEYRTTAAVGELSNDQIEGLYVLARQIYNEHYNTHPNQDIKSENIFNATEVNEHKEDEDWKVAMLKQNESIQGLHEKLEAFIVDEKTNDNKRNKRCFHCNKIGHFKTDCWIWQSEQRNQNSQTPFNNERRLKSNDNSRFNKPSTEYQHTQTNKSRFCGDGYCALPLNNNKAMMVHGKINNKDTKMLIDTGAGPCIIGLNKLRKIKTDNLNR